MTNEIQESGHFTTQIDHSPEAFFTMVLQAEWYKRAAEKMRHRVFVDELGWVGSNNTECESDSYDSVSVHLGVFRNKDVIGHLRLTRRPHAFMLENEFARLLPSGLTLESNLETAEISRLCIEEKYRSQRILWEGRQVFVSEMLYASLWKWCQASHVVVLYFATTPRVARLLRMQGFPCRMLDRPNSELGAVACQLDWREYRGPHHFTKNTSYQSPCTIACATA